MPTELERLRQMTDEQLIAGHDQLVAGGVMPEYYLHELERRERARSDRRLLGLTVATLVLAAVSVVIAIVALFVR